VALVARERLGIGQRVDASHLGSMTWLQGLSVSARLMMGHAHPRMARQRAGNPLWNHYRCQDGKWLAVGMIQADRYWGDFTKAIGRPELASDPRFADMASRSKNCEACIAILDEVFAARPRAEWLDILRRGGDFIFTVVNTVDELPDDPQVLANQYIVDFDHPKFGPGQVVGVPVGLSETPGSVRAPAPEFGQHTEEVLTELLGYSWEEVGELRAKQVT
jgi:crotonobetainyl-CoA:carnitine CoA-transferase CaiB-like acyl-CoA transferase